MDDPGSLLLRNYNADRNLAMGGADGYSDYLEIYANLPTVLTVNHTHATRQATVTHACASFTGEWAARAPPF